MVFSSPAFGIYPAEDRTISSIGSLVSTSKKSMNGWWCPWCYAEGVYNWVEPCRYSKEGNHCNRCRKYTNINMEEVKAIMATK